MSTCPLCKRSYLDEAFSYCPVDGARLSIQQGADAVSALPSDPAWAGEKAARRSKYYLLEDVVLPSLGFFKNGSKIIKWLKNVGDTVQPSEGLIEISTSKAVVELPSTCSGVLM